MNEQTHLPSRRDRLRTFVKLKAQRRFLIGAMALILPAGVALAAGYIDEATETERVPLGTGIASVDAPDDAAPRVAYRPASKRSETTERAFESGNASYYARELAGRRTANGEAFDPTRLTAAHRTLPFGTRVRVTNQRNGKSVIVRIDDRGPFHRARVIDLSEAAASRIGMLNRGHGRVKLTLLQG